MNEFETGEREDRMSIVGRAIQSGLVVGVVAGIAVGLCGFHEPIKGWSGTLLAVADAGVKGGTGGVLAGSLIGYLHWRLGGGGSSGDSRSFVQQDAAAPFVPARFLRTLAALGSSLIWPVIGIVCATQFGIDFWWVIPPILITPFVTYWWLGRLGRR